MLLLQLPRRRIHFLERLLDMVDLVVFSLLVSRDLPVVGAAQDVGVVDVLVAVAVLLPLDSVGSNPFVKSAIQPVIMDVILELFGIGGAPSVDDIGGMPGAVAAFDRDRGPDLKLLLAAAVAVLAFAGGALAVGAARGLFVLLAVLGILCDHHFVARFPLVSELPLQGR